jgi:hypothetical protein
MTKALGVLTLPVSCGPQEKTQATAKKRVLWTICSTGLLGPEYGIARPAPQPFPKFEGRPPAETPTASRSSARCRITRRAC